LEHFEVGADLNGWTTDAAKVSGLKLQLKNDAREWLRDQDTTDWKKLRELFLGELGFTLLQNLRGPHDVDLFADQTTNLLPRYVR
jgi:hypothetical protein